MASKPKETEAPEVENFDDLDFERPQEGVTLGESFLYRPGPTKRHGGDGKPGSVMGLNNTTSLHCGWKPVQGLLVHQVTRYSETYKKDYHQIVLQLTKPAVGISQGKHVRLNPGQCIVITTTGALREIGEFANHPGLTAEIYLKPTGDEVPTKRQPMRVYDRVLLRYVKRSEITLPGLPKLPEPEAIDVEGVPLEEGRKAPALGARS